MFLTILCLVLVILIILIIVTKMIFRRMPKNIRGKVALVTGGGNGLGRELCIELSKQGCKIAIADVDYDGALKTLGLIENEKAKAYKIDLVKNEDIESLKDQVLKDFGRVDILVNNAGLISYSTIFLETPLFIEKMIKVNLTAPILLVRAFMPLMIDQKEGHIVSISSAMGLYHTPDAVAYSSTKFGLTGFMMGMREMIRRKKLEKFIYTTTVFPYAIATNDVVNNAVRKGFLVLQADKVAVEIIKAIRLNKNEISIPKNLHKEIRCFQTFPRWLQNLIRDIRNESKQFNVVGLDEI